MLYKNVIKRIIDFTLSIFGFILLLPVTIVIYFILLFKNNDNPFFFQPRPGKNEKIFKIIKFKTMTDKKDSHGELLPDGDRITSFGNFLRKTSLDEIPQLINIIKGDMSLVGPRPLRIRYLPYYTEKEKARHSVRPGITGLAQISGRNFLHWDDRLKKDVEYVESISLSTDFKIIIKTFFKVLSGKDVALDSNTVMVDIDVLRKKNTD